jgi:hypothetical protein
MRSDVFLGYIECAKNVLGDNDYRKVVAKVSAVIDEA